MSTAIHLANKEQCTACGACMCICPTHSIEMRCDEMGCEYPYINENTCVGCGRCARVCPVDKNYVSDSAPHSVYAAWNTNFGDRNKAASGGIATAIYRYSLQKGIKTYGVKYTPHKSASYIAINSEEDIEACRNSKYVFSDITPILPSIKKDLSSGSCVIVIALPCQAAAVLGYLGGRVPGLTLVDIACHGVCPVTYLNQHISMIENKKKRTVRDVYFRDPKFGTGKFVLSMYDEKVEAPVYNCGVYRNDVYQIGYHKALTYRENCFNCKYAKQNRVGDLTISDFSGLGRVRPFEHERKSVSCVMASTDDGEKLLRAMLDLGMIETELRPSEEAFRYEKMFQHPSIPHAAVDTFRKNYINTCNFEKSARLALRRDIRKNMLRYYLHADDIKRLAAKGCPKKIKGIIKKLVRNHES